MIPKKMKAAVMRDVNRIVIEDIPVPRPSDDDVLVKVKAVGICGSDVHLFANGKIGPHVVTPPYVLGHEASGEIVATGKDVHQFKPGDKVTMEPGVPCGMCEFCKSGRYNLCNKMAFWAAPPVPGVLQEYITHKANFCFKIGVEMPYDVASLAEPLSVGIYAATRGEASPGKTVAIIGMGPIGQTALQAMLSFGVKNIIVSDIIDSRIKLAKKMGARRVVNNTKEGVTDAVMEFTENMGVDLILETAGIPETEIGVLDMVKKGGTVIYIGNPEVLHVSFPLLPIIEKDMRIYGSYRYVNTYPTAVNILSSSKDIFKNLISHHFPLYRAQEAFELVRDQKNKCMKVIINVFET